MELNERQMSIMYRIENGLRNVCEDSKLSEKERKAMEFLEGIQKRICSLEEDIRRIEAGSKHGEERIGHRSEAMMRRGIDLTDTRGRTMRKQLHNLTNDISHLMRRIKLIEENVPELMFQSQVSTPYYN